MAGSKNRSRDANRVESIGHAFGIVERTVSYCTPEAIYFGRMGFGETWTSRVISGVRQWEVCTGKSIFRSCVSLIRCSVETTAVRMYINFARRSKVFRSARRVFLAGSENETGFFEGSSSRRRVRHRSRTRDRSRTIYSGRSKFLGTVKRGPVDREHCKLCISVSMFESNALLIRYSGNGSEREFHETSESGPIDKRHWQVYTGRVVLNGNASLISCYVKTSHRRRWYLETRLFKGSRGREFGKSTRRYSRAR